MRSEEKTCRRQKSKPQKSCKFVPEMLILIKSTVVLYSTVVESELAVLRTVVVLLLLTKVAALNSKELVASRNHDRGTGGAHRGGIHEKAAGRCPTEAEGSRLPVSSLGRAALRCVLVQARGDVTVPQCQPYILAVSGGPHWMSAVQRARLER